MDIGYQGRLKGTLYYFQEIEWGLPVTERMVALDLGEILARLMREVGMEEL